MATRGNMSGPAAGGFFTEATEQAIVAWQSAPDPEERNRIYGEHIHAALQNLAGGVFAKYGSGLPLSAKDELATELYFRLGKAKGNFATYLYAAAKNLLYDQQKRARKVASLHCEIVDDQPDILIDTVEPWHSQQQLEDDAARKQFIADLIADLFEHFSRCPLTLKVVRAVADCFDASTDFDSKADLRNQIQEKLAISESQYRNHVHLLRERYAELTHGDYPQHHTANC